MLQTYPDSPSLVELCHLAGALNEELVMTAHAAGALRKHFAGDDMHALLRGDHDRRTVFILEGLSGRA